MVWLELIGGNSGAYYLDAYACEIRSRPDRFSCSLSGILGDGNWESPVLVEIGEDVSITFLQDSCEGLRASIDMPDIDIRRLETAIRDALDVSSGPWGHSLLRPNPFSPHAMGRQGASGRAYSLEDESPSPRVCEPSGHSKTAA